MFSKNCCFAGFERVKSNFATFWTPGKSFLIPLENPLVVPLANIFYDTHGYIHGHCAIYFIT